MSRKLHLLTTKRKLITDLDTYPSYYYSKTFSPNDSTKYRYTISDQTHESIKYVSILHNRYALISSWSNKSNLDQCKDPEESKQLEFWKVFWDIIKLKMQKKYHNSNKITQLPPIKKCIKTVMKHAEIRVANFIA